ncbi:UNVERIFIED_CONTAM: hypothetical protein FKN15_066513 [Acipenser sinensis]
MQFADQINQPTPKQSQSERRKGAELRNKEDLPGPEEGGQNQGEELSQEKEQRLKDGHDIIMEWARELKTVPENSVSAGEAVEQGLAELVKEWKRGKLSNILPIMEFIMWALIKEEADKLSGGRGGWLSEGSSVAELVLWLVDARKGSGSGWAVLLQVAMAQAVLGRAVWARGGLAPRRCVSCGSRGSPHWLYAALGGAGWAAAHGFILEGFSKDPDTFLVEVHSDVQLPGVQCGGVCQVDAGHQSTPPHDLSIDITGDVWGVSALGSSVEMTILESELLHGSLCHLPHCFDHVSALAQVIGAVDVTLDPDTAYPGLTLSAEGKRVRLGGWQDLADNPERFDWWDCVVGREGFTSGRCYWQVQVGGNTRWRLGVSRESAERKGKFNTTPQQGYWTVERDEDNDVFTALTDLQTPLPHSLKPQKLGVYLDYEEGQLSFYNVETRSHIYTFTDMEFNPNEKLYPLFCTVDSNTDLVLESPDRDPDPVSAAD